jgi:hypothetical protein
MDDDSHVPSAYVARFADVRCESLSIRVLTWSKYVKDKHFAKKGLKLEAHKRNTKIRGSASFRKLKVYFSFFINHLVLMGRSIVIQSSDAM